MSIKAPSYKAPGFEGGVGNLICDVIKYAYSGKELVDVPILLRKMSERNTYVRCTIIGAAGITALTAADIGFINREGGADAPSALADDAVLTVASAETLAAPVTPGFKHDVALTHGVLADAAAEVGEEITIILEFVATG